MNIKTWRERQVERGTGSIEAKDDEINELRAALAERDLLALDAARYRWLRVNPQWLGWDADYEAENIDLILDLAMKGKS